MSTVHSAHPGGSDPQALLLRQSGLLEPGADDALDRFTRLAARLLRAPVAQLNLVRDGSQVTVSGAGAAPWDARRAVPLSHSYCQHVMASGEALVIDDTARHPLVRENLATSESGIAAYAAFPVRVGGRVVASLCAVDFEPRHWTEEVVAGLRDLASGVETELALRIEVAERMRVEAELRRNKDALEARVRERTADLERINRELRWSEQRYRSLFDHNPHAVYGFDLDGRFVAANRAVESVLGVKPETLLGTRFMDLVPEEARARAEEIFEHVLRGDPRTYELPIITPDGRRLLVRGVSVPVVVDGRLEGVIGVAEDVTERERLEGELRQAQKMEAVGRLAGGIAHDFNNLITGIRGFTRLLMDDPTVEGPAREDLLEIDRAAGRAADLTRQILAFSRKQVLRPEVLDLNHVVTDARRLLERVIGADVRLEAELEEDLPVVLADRGQMEQVVFNLAVNARDAMPTGGTLTLRTRRVTGDVPRVALSVTDTGTGMTAEVRTRVFEPFFTTKEPGKGTGMGLSTVHGIVAQSGGTVELESEPGRGTTFTVLLPVTEPTSDATDEPEAHPPATTVSGVVLLVEDEVGVRSIVRRILERRGYQVLTASDGEEALGVAEGHDGDIDLLLTDLVMPRMGGIELASRLVEQRPDMRVVMMSGRSEPSVTWRRDGRGVLDVLEKPFTTEQVAGRVREALLAASA